MKEIIPIVLRIEVAKLAMEIAAAVPPDRGSAEARMNAWEESYKRMIDAVRDNMLSAKPSGALANTLPKGGTGTE